MGGQALFEKKWTIHPVFASGQWYTPVKWWKVMFDNQ